ncbi:MAG: HAD-IC family P-type ATPase, partial [Candidatus Saccharibacteria bacterium]
MSDYLRIIKRNFLSPIVISIVILGLILLYLGEKKDAYFVTFVVLVNSFIGIIQEIRAKIALKKLELLNAQKARRLANNSKDAFDLIDTDQVQIKDRLLLLTGDEIPVDGELLSSSGLEVDESMLTGESVAVKKKIHDQVFASTIVTAGSGILITEAVKDDTRAGFYSKKLKNYSPELTPIQKSIWLAITGLTYLALGLTILIYISYSLNEINSVVILKTIITAATAVVPEGLL